MSGLRRASAGPPTRRSGRQAGSDWWPGRWTRRWRRPWSAASPRSDRPSAAGRPGGPRRRRWPAGPCWSPGPRPGWDWPRPAEWPDWGPAWSSPPVATTGPSGPLTPCGRRPRPPTSPTCWPTWASSTRCAGWPRSSSAGHDRLDVLIHNAGALTRQFTVTGSGTELTVASQVAAPYLLTGLLLPALEAAAPSRVIQVSSGGMYTQRFDLGSLEMGPDDYDGTVGLRPGQTGPAGADARVGPPHGRHRGVVPRHAPGLGRHAGHPRKPARLRPGHGTAAALARTRGRTPPCGWRRLPRGSRRRAASGSTAGRGGRTRCRGRACPSEEFVDAGAEPCGRGAPPAPDGTAPTDRT